MDQTCSLRVDTATIRQYRQKIDRLKKPALWLLEHGKIQCFFVKRIKDVVAFHEGYILNDLDDGEVLRHYSKSRRLIVLKVEHEPKLIENYIPEVLVRAVRRCSPQILTFDLRRDKTPSIIRGQRHRNGGKDLIDDTHEGNANRSNRKTSRGTKPVRRRPLRHPEYVPPSTWEPQTIDVWSVSPANLFWKKKQYATSQPVTDDSSPSGGSVHYAIDTASTRDDVRKLESHRGKMVVSSSAWLRRSNHPKFPMKPPKHQEFYMPDERMKTYRLWDSSEKPSPEVMSSCGFYSAGRGDLVRCFQCGIGLKDWSPDDDPIIEHIRVSDNCPFLVAELGQDVIEELKSEVLAPPEQDIPSANVMDSASGGSNELPFPVRAPMYQTMEARLESLKDLPSSVKQSRKSIAVAGFYFTGRGDLCRCFACDGGLKTWDPADDPMEEHAKHFPRCDYLRHIKGDRYIQETQRKGQGARGIQPTSSTGSQVYGSSGSSDQRPGHVNTRGDPPDAGHHVASGSSPADQSPASRSLLEMGFTNQAVMEALSRLRLGGNPNPTTEQLVNAAIEC